ncbi:maleylpyruvate isomerase family mycothiol-dependent enzyme [Rhizohabitans arisaemae]|uniref:maleylpyruvate isomerase family mycothiol-dependent enzyme n=1 Tax=Rhizohabitans arisaemae TaxID=2720610 RepID=UPI0024B0AFB3|nr:maleylpyruvate isomerase family mycothiol-dependent enzyme [Rhizohabitans arisaemae]
MTFMDDRYTGWLEWTNQGTAVFDEHLTSLADEELDVPSLLPGWTRAHVAAHVAGNAQALVRLLSWARTGRERRMYPDAATRERDIEDGARLAPAALRDLVARTGAELADAVRALPHERWTAEVVTSGGRTVPAVEVLWMRVREVWIHAVDLDNGMSFHRFPAPLLDALLSDMVESRRRGRQEPPLLLTPTDRAATWDVPLDGRPPTRLIGSTAGIVAGLSGRNLGEITFDGDSPPDLGRWL